MHHRPSVLRSLIHALGCLVATITAVIGSACGAGPSHPPVAPEDDGHDHDARRSHAHGGAGAHGHEHAAHSFADAEALASTLDDPARDAWQRPEDVLRAMELAPTMSVADVGAGTGYFAMRLARAVPMGEVIATDIEPNMVRFVSERTRREGLSNVRAILATQSGSGLARESVDRILVMHVWHHLPDRRALARDLSAALRPGAKLFVVDFAIAARRGPPPSMRVAPETIIAELEAAGLTAMVSAIALPDQYIVEARRERAR